MPADTLTDGLGPRLRGNNRVELVRGPPGPSPVVDVLIAEGVSSTFIDYLRSSFKGVVAA